jgi:hypothetical protein
MALRGERHKKQLHYQGTEVDLERQPGSNAITIEGINRDFC